jgi:hypothetical protein
MAISRYHIPKYGDLNFNFLNLIILFTWLSSYFSSIETKQTKSLGSMYVSGYACYALQSAKSRWQELERTLI